MKQLPPIPARTRGRTALRGAAHAVVLTASLGAVACGGVPTRKFQFKVVDTSEQPRPALIVIDNQDFATAAEKNQFVSVDSNDWLSLTLSFPSSEVEITVAPVVVDGNRVSRVPKDRKEAVELSNFKDDTRRLHLDDPQKQLFILPRAGTGG